MTSNTVTGLTDGGTYAFQVRGVDVDTDTGTRSPGDPSDEVTVSLSGTVETGGLSAPRNFDAAAGNGRVTLSWDAPASDGGVAISGYQYQRRAGAGAYGQWTTIPGGSSIRSYIVTGLANGTRYFFRVRAVNSDGAGPGSTEESATPSLGVDTTLRTLSLSTVALAPVTLTPAFTPATRTYTATVTGSVTQVTVAATANKTGLPPPTITPADASTAVAGHQVALAVGLNTIRVTVADGTNSDVYTITVTRAARVPAAPTGLTAATAEDGGGAVTLSWTAPTGGGAVSRYEYQQKAGTDAYGAWTPIPGSGPSTTSHTVTGLTNGTAYAFRVRAVNSVGNGAASNEATATPALVRLVWAKTEREVADTITAARNAGYGDDMTFTRGRDGRGQRQRALQRGRGRQPHVHDVVGRHRRGVCGGERRHGNGDGESSGDGHHHHHRPSEPAVGGDDRGADRSARGQHHVPRRGRPRGAHPGALRPLGRDEPRGGRQASSQWHGRHGDGEGDSQPAGHRGRDRDAAARPGPERRHRHHPTTSRRTPS